MVACLFSNFGTPRIHTTFLIGPLGPTHRDTPSSKQDSDSNHGGKPLSVAIPMQAPLRFLALIARCIPDFFRNRREQVIVELALRQHLATYNQQKAKPKGTSLDGAFWVGCGENGAIRRRSSITMGV